MCSTWTIPEIFLNPILYVWEPGYWTIQASEAENLRKYLLKGGFIIFDDFEGDHWDNLVAQMHRALPDHDFVKIDERHPIFHSFYNIDKIHVPHPSMNVTPGYYAMYENNDPTRRMIALANHNSDIAEYLGMVRRGPLQPRSHQQRLSPWGELLRLRDDALKGARERATRIPRCPSLRSVSMPICSKESVSSASCDPRRFRPRRFLPRCPAATCSPARRPAAARPQPFSCPSCTG